MSQGNLDINVLNTKWNNSLIKNNLKYPKP